ncbi:MAG: hypothetical protein U5K75_10925 [Ahrensia sp.]|nr:hypothetical protein [Ahrensia sp.]
MTRVELRFIDQRGVAHTSIEAAVARDLAHKIAGPRLALLAADPIALWIIENRADVESSYANIDFLRKEYMND